MNFLSFYQAVRNVCPELAAKADKVHIEIWENLSEDQAFIWFESLAKALNLEMAANAEPETYKSLFDLLSEEFRTGSNDVKKCIDVSLIENLFWQIPAQKIVPFWNVFPDNLRTLYLNFHGKPPL